MTRLVMLFAVSATVLSAAQPRFDPKDIARQCRPKHSATRSRILGSHPMTPGLDDGEFLIDTNNAVVPAFRNQDAPAVTYGGGSFLVVWADDREGSERDIYGARVTASGIVLDQFGVPISTAPSNQQCPAVSFDGTNYFVVWADTRRGFYDLYGARVSLAGTVIDPSGIPVSLVTAYSSSPAVCYDGTDFLVVWDDIRNGASDIYAARVSPSGIVLDPNGIAVSVAAGAQTLPAVTHSGTNSLVVWEDHRTGSSDIYGARVTPQGTVLDTLGIAISSDTTSQASPAVSCDGPDFLVVWGDRRSGSWDIYGARVTSQGTLVDSSGIIVSPEALSQNDPSVAFDGTNYLLAWDDARGGTWDIYGARVSPQGRLLDSLGLAISAGPSRQHASAVAFGDANFLVVWTYWHNGAYSDIYGARVTPQGALPDTSGIAVATAAREQESPDVASDGVNFLVVWSDYRYSCDSFSDICGIRVTPNGTVLDSLSIGISTVVSHKETPAVTYDGADFLVVWTDNRNGFSDIFGARVTPQGAVLDSLGMPISTAPFYQQNPQVASDGSNALVVWGDDRIGVDDIYAARVSREGAVLDPSGIAVSTAGGWQRFPAVCYDGANFLLVWEDSPDGQLPDIRGARVSSQGAVLDSSGIAISTAAYSQENPALSFDGTNSVVVWRDWRNGSNSNIYGARVTSGGTVLDTSGIPISTVAHDGTHPALAFSGTNFIVTWQDCRNSSSYDLYGAWVTPSGTVLDGSQVVQQEGDQLYSKLSRGSSDNILLVYQGWAGIVSGKTYSTYRIWGKMNPLPGVEETPNGEVRRTNPMPTIVRGLLELAAGSRQHTAYRAELLDISGRKVLDLHPGPNDVSRLAPGVYFVRSTDGSERSAVRKIVITE